jgi:hypothetical protein
MKRIDVQNQPVLSPGRIFQIAVTGVKYRLFRAAVTVAVIIVAMAFLMNILTESLIKRAVAESVRDQIEDLHRVDRWIARLSMPQRRRKSWPAWPRWGKSVPRAAESKPGSPNSPYLSWPRCRICWRISWRCRPAARDDGAYLRFFADLITVAVACWSGPAESTRIFERLQDERAWHQFTSNLADMRTVRFPVPLEELPGLSRRLA